MGWVRVRTVGSNPSRNRPVVATRVPFLGAPDLVAVLMQTGRRQVAIAQTATIRYGDNDEVWYRVNGIQDIDAVVIPVKLIVSVNL